MKTRITKDMRNRLMDLAAYGPLTRKDIDHELEQLNLIRVYEFYSNVVEIIPRVSDALYNEYGQLNTTNFELV